MSSSDLVADPLDDSLGDAAGDTASTEGTSARERAQRKIIKAARTAMATRGLETTVDDVAEIAGISRRTVFRHFGTREHLLARALRAGLESYGSNLPLHREGEAVDQWLRRLLGVVHGINEGNGRIYWEITALQTQLDGELRDAADARREARVRFVGKVTEKLWSLSGGEGEIPAWLSDTVAVHLSAFTTQSLRLDFDRSPEEIAEMSTEVLLSAAATAVAATRPAV